MPNESMPQQQPKQLQPRQAEGLTKREMFALHLGASLLTARPNATPAALAKQVAAFTDAFLDALAASVN